MARGGGPTRSACKAADRDMAEHDSIYAQPELYELAFSYRDIEAECDFLLARYRDARGGRATSFLEVAAGPASHARWMARAVNRCAALDLSEEMVRYGRNRAAAEGVRLDYRLADMCSFVLTAQFDLAACLLDSASYLHDDEQVRQHLHCMAGALRDGGVYVLELAHPRVIEGGAPSTAARWSESSEGIDLEVTWSPQPGDPARPRLARYRARFVASGADGKRRTYESDGVQRQFRLDELDALVRDSGRFRLHSVHGAFDAEVALDADRAWRMLVVLVKEPGTPNDAPP